MTVPILLIGFVVLVCFLNWWLPRTNTGLGRTLRESDHAAWQYAVEDKEQELAELRGAEPKRGSNDH